MKRKQMHSLFHYIPDNSGRDIRFPEFINLQKFREWVSKIQTLEHWNKFLPRNVCHQSPITQWLVSKFITQHAFQVKMFRIFDQKFAFVQAFPPFSSKLCNIFRRKSAPCEIFLIAGSSCGTTLHFRPCYENSFTVPVSLTHQSRQ